MRIYQQEIVVRIWDRDNKHVSASVRNVDPEARMPAQQLPQNKKSREYGTYISWAAAKENLAKAKKLKTAGFQPKTATMRNTYQEDKYVATNADTQAAFSADKVNREFQIKPDATKHQTQTKVYVDENYDGEAEYEDILLTSAHHKINIPNFSVRVLKLSEKTINNPNLPSYDAQAKFQRNVGFDNVDYVTRLPVDATAFWGLNLSSIQEWWREIWFGVRGNRFDNYFYKEKSAKFNDAGMIMEALKQGGAEAYVKMPFALINRNSADVLAYANKLAKKLDILNRHTNDFKLAVERDEQYARRDLVGERFHHSDIWTLDEFISASRVKYGFRKGQVENIDKSLKAYHKLGEWKPESFNAKLTELVTIMENVIEHKFTKPQSDRRVAVDTLGMQIISKLSQANFISMIKVIDYNKPR